jgi:hypothetical protein
MPQSLYKEAPTVSVPNPGVPDIGSQSVPSQPSVSPTGTPVVPPAAVPYLLAGVVAVDLVAEELSDPAPWTSARTLRLISRLVVYALLGASPGLRRR